MEKILNIHIRDYLELSKKILGEYELRGVHSSSGSLKEFAQLVPNETEVVVNYNIQFFGAGCEKGSIKFHYNQEGIALIPKKRRR